MRRRVSAGDPVRIALERTRRRWAAARAGRLDLGEVREAMREAFPGAKYHVLALEGFPGACRLFLWTDLGRWVSMYAFDVAHVSAFAAGANRV